MSDVWNTANEATLGPRNYFGQVFTDGFYCVLRKGIGKVPFDASQHDIDERRTAISIDGIATKRDGTNYEIHREMLAESREWAGIVLPSLKVCGVHPGDLNEKWAQWQLVENGQTWTSKTTGDLVKGTTFKFLAIYDSEEECRAAEAAHYSRAPSEDEDSGLPMPEVSKDDGNGNGGGPEKAVAAQFLPALWAQSGNDVSQFAALLAGNPLTSRFFDLNSPEVIELVAS